MFSDLFNDHVYKSYKNRICNYEKNNLNYYYEARLLTKSK